MIKTIVAICTFFVFSATIYSQNIDIDLLREINVNRNKSLDPTFRFVSSTVTPICIASPVLVYAVGIAQKDSSLKYKGIYIGETILVSVFFSTALKYSIKRERPFTTYSFIDKATMVESPSFPSGHTSDAFATATSLSIAFPKWYVIAPSFLWASAVGYSRLDLGVHYPSDVLAGTIIGIGSAYLSYKLNNWLLKKRNK